MQVQSSPLDASSSGMRLRCPVCLAVFRTGFERCPADGGRLTPWEGDPLLGTELAGRYVIEALVGQGSMGLIYRARHVCLPRWFAVKILFGDLSADSRMRTRFAQEAALASRLSHPNVVPVVDFGRTDSGLLYLVMDFVEGEVLGDLMARESPIEPVRAIRIARQLAQGLGHAHKRGLVHRDFKPSNVLLERQEAGPPVPRVVDFGLAICTRQRDETPSRLTEFGLIVGTPIYIAPEQVLDLAIDQRADLFALGVVMYEMLAGQPPFDGRAVEIAHKNVVQPVPPIAQRSPGVLVDLELERVVRRLLEKSPADRYASADEVCAALDAVEAVIADSGPGQGTRPGLGRHIPPALNPPNPPGLGQQTPSGLGRQTPSGLGQQTPSGLGQQTPSGLGRQTPSGRRLPIPPGPSPTILPMRAVTVPADASSEAALADEEPNRPDQRAPVLRRRLAVALALLFAAGVAIYAAIRGPSSPRPVPGSSAPPAQLAPGDPMRPALPPIALPPASAEPGSSSAEPGSAPPASAEPGSAPVSAVPGSVPGSALPGSASTPGAASATSPSKSNPTSTPSSAPARARPPIAAVIRDPAARSAAPVASSPTAADKVPAAVAANEAPGPVAPDPEPAAAAESATALTEPVPPAAAAIDPLAALRAAAGRPSAEASETGVGLGKEPKKDAAPSIGAVSGATQPGPGGKAPTAPRRDQPGLRADRPALPAPSEAKSAAAQTVDPAPQARGPIAVSPARTRRVSGAVPPIQFPRWEKAPGQITAKLCIDTQGAVTSVSVTSPVSRNVRTTVEQALATWRYRPVVDAGEAVAACFVTSLRVQVD
jgi:serine/threonine protein kinase